MARSMSVSSNDTKSWVAYFCSLTGNEFLVEVDEDYIHDRFNLTGLNEQVPHYDGALLIIKDEDIEMIVQEAAETPVVVFEQAAELLYGMIHARYLLNQRGCEAMRKKYEDKEFGICPRFYCDSQPMLPIGLSDVPGEANIKLYCPRCKELYVPKLPHLHCDGAFFGTGFPHMFFMIFPDLRPSPPVNPFVPRMFGFRIHSSAFHPNK